MNRLYMTLLLVVAGLIASGAGAAEYAGVVKTVRGAASVDRSGQRIAAAPGTRVEQGDRLVTGEDGRLGITMRDETLLTMGPRSELTLDAYAFDPKTHEGNFLASLKNGILGVVTGLLPRQSPQSFQVKTKVSTMGVRGTEFIIDASE